MLLSCLQRHAKGAVAEGIDAYSDDTAWDGSLEIIFHGEESGVRATKSEGNAKALCGSAGCIGAELSRRSEQGKRQQVCGHYHISICCMHFVDELAVVFHRTFVVGILNQCTKITIVDRHRSVIAGNHFNAYRRCAGDDHIDGLRESIFVYKKFGAGDMIMVSVECVEEHGHGFCCSCAFVEKGGIGDGRPVRSLTMVWKFSRLSRRPCEISAW